MDLTRPVTYRGAALNTVTPTVGRLGLLGCMTETANIRDITHVQFMEKRREADGMDAIEPYLALHKLVLSGTVFGRTRGETWDRLQILRRTFSPTEALRESPSTKGFLPIAFSDNLDRTLLVRPTGFKFTFDSTRHGTSAKVAGKNDAVGLGVRWIAELLVDYPSLCENWPPTPPPIVTCATLTEVGVIQYWSQINNFSGATAVLPDPPDDTPAATFVAGNYLQSGTAIGAITGPIPGYNFLDLWTLVPGYDHTRITWGYTTGTPGPFLPDGGIGSAGQVVCAAYIPTRTTSFPNHNIGPGSYCDLLTPPTPGSLILFYLAAQSVDSPPGPIPGWTFIGGDMCTDGGVAPNKIGLYARCAVEGDGTRIAGYHANLVSWNLMVEVPIT